MKHFLGLMKSKTFWFNAVTGTLSIVDALNGKLIPVEISGTVIAIGNVILRLMTSTAIKDK